MVKPKTFTNLISDLGISPFTQRFPWLGGDLQTLRDTFVDENLYIPAAESFFIEVPSKQNRISEKEYLLAFLNRPLNTAEVKGVVLMLHGLGGSSRRRGLRRMAFTLLKSGFAVLRLNLRGASPGREFAAGTYAANCNSDVLPAIEKAREICRSFNKKTSLVNSSIPLFGVGISLGGTILLNASLEASSFFGRNAFDGLVCISSPLDLEACSASIERPRNSFYQSWLLKRLVKQTFEDPFGVTDSERDFLAQRNFLNIPISSSIRAFDSAITAPRWGFKDVDDYYMKASPLNALLAESLESLPKTLLIQSLDDPWVPSEPASVLSKSILCRNLSSKLEILLSEYGGHNGFHGLNGCWGDEVVKRWLIKVACRKD